MPPLTPPCYREVDDQPGPMLRLRRRAFHERLDWPDATSSDSEFAGGGALHPAFLLQAGERLQDYMRVPPAMAPATLSAGITAGPDESVVACAACRRDPRDRVSHCYSSRQTGRRITAVDWQRAAGLEEGAEWLLRPALSRETPA